MGQEEGNSAAAAAAAIALCHLSCAQHVAALLSAAAPVQPPPALSAEPERARAQCDSSQGAYSGSLGAVLGALDAARESAGAAELRDQAAGGGGGQLVADEQDWRGRASICQVNI